MFYNKVAVSHRSGTGIILLDKIEKIPWVSQGSTRDLLYLLKSSVFNASNVKMFTLAKIAEWHKLSWDIQSEGCL